MNRTPGRLAAAVAIVAFAVYALTAARTITFWEGAHYSLLARTLSITNPPGSLLLTLIGRVLSDLPFAWPIAFRLNLIAAMIGAATAAVLVRLGAGIFGDLAKRSGDGARNSEDVAPRSNDVARMGGIVAALTYAFAATSWTHATQFSPYGLSAFFTALILAAFVRWWHHAQDSHATGAAALVALLLGVDVSVHRANLLLVPGLVAGLLLRRPGAVVRPSFLAAMAFAFVAGLALQLLYIPLSLREPFLDVSAPNSLAALWSFVRLDPIGGGFLMNLWPRRADFVSVQLADLARFVRENLGGGGWSTWTGAALAALGSATLLRRSPRLAICLLALALSAGFGAVLYFNRPETYFRTLDRHYLPFLVTLAPLLAAGVGAVVSGVTARAGRSTGIAIALLALALPLSNAIRNYTTRDLSETRFAERFGRDLIEPLARNAVILTNGDNDSFPPWYLQQVERVRPDVLVINIPVTYSPAGARRVQRADPAFASFVPSFPPSDSVVADLTRRCLGRRPIYFAVTLVVPEPIPGISERLRPAGLSWRVVPPGDERAADSTFAALEMFVRERLPRAGFDDPRQRFDEDLKLLGSNYAGAAFQLVIAQMSRGDGPGALATLDHLERHYPASRRPPMWEAMWDQLTRTRQQAQEMVRSQR